MADNLDAKLRVATDLLQQGATEVEISDSAGKIVAKRGPAAPALTSQPSSVVNVAVVANAAAEATANSYVQQLTSIRQELIDKHPDKKKEIQQQFRELEQELRKVTPSKRLLRKFIVWACQFDWDTLLKLLTIILGQA